jgi:DNA polymerase
MFIGEGPGADEDEQGEPFVGPAGRLLDKMIAAMGYERDDVYVGNIVKCRATDGEGQNRPPAPEEIKECHPFLVRQITAINPYVIVTLGSPATKTILGTEEGITRLRGKWQQREFMGQALRCDINIMPTYHPAFLLRTPAAKRYVWKDLKLVLAKLAARGFLPPKAMKK